MPALHLTPAVAYKQDNENQALHKHPQNNKSQRPKATSATLDQRRLPVVGAAAAAAVLVSVLLVVAVVVIVIVVAGGVEAQ